MAERAYDPDPINNMHSDWYWAIMKWISVHRPEVYAWMLHARHPESCDSPTSFDCLCTALAFMPVVSEIYHDGDEHILGTDLRWIQQHRREVFETALSGALRDNPNLPGGMRPAR